MASSQAPTTTSEDIPPNLRPFLGPSLKSLNDFPSLHSGSSKVPPRRTERVSKPPSRLVNNYLLGKAKNFNAVKAKAKQGFFVELDVPCDGNLNIRFSPGFFSSVVLQSLVPPPSSWVYLEHKVQFLPIKQEVDLVGVLIKTNIPISIISSHDVNNSTSMKVHLSVHHTSHCLQLQGSVIPKWLVERVLVPICHANAANFSIQDLESLEQAIADYEFPEPQQQPPASPCNSPPQESSSFSHSGVIEGEPVMFPSNVGRDRLVSFLSPSKSSTTLVCAPAGLTTGQGSILPPTSYSLSSTSSSSSTTDKESSSFSPCGVVEGEPVRFPSTDRRVRLGITFSASSQSSVVCTPAGLTTRQGSLLPPTSSSIPVSTSSSSTPVHGSLNYSARSKSSSPVISGSSASSPTTSSPIKSLPPPVSTITSTPSIPTSSQSPISPSNPPPVQSLPIVTSTPTLPTSPISSHSQPPLSKSQIVQVAQVIERDLINVGNCWQLLETANLTICRLYEQIRVLQLANSDRDCQICELKNHIHQLNAPQSESSSLSLDGVVEGEQSSSSGSPSWLDDWAGAAATPHSWDITIDQWVDPNHTSSMDDMDQYWISHAQNISKSSIPSLMDIVVPTPSSLPKFSKFVTFTGPYRPNPGYRPSRSSYSSSYPPLTGANAINVYKGNNYRVFPHNFKCACPNCKAKSRRRLY